MLIVMISAFRNISRFRAITNPFTIEVEPNFNSGLNEKMNHIFAALPKKWIRRVMQGRTSGCVS